MIQPSSDDSWVNLLSKTQYFTYITGTQTGRAYLYGAEYQTAGSYDNGLLNSFQDHNVPCAVCYISTRETVVMIPAHYTPAHHPGQKLL